MISKETLHQTLACFPVVLDQFLIGLGWGWPAPTIAKLQSSDAPFTVTPEEASWIASINEIGRVFAPFISPLLVDNIGRKYTLVLISIMYFAVWSTISFARTALVLCIARVLFGVANGINDVVAGIYTTENCSSSFRGIIGGIVQLMYFGALFVEFVLATYLSYFHTAIVNTVIAACGFLVLYFVTETPYFLVMKGKYEEAEKSLIWLRGGVEQRLVADELDKIKESVEEEKKKKKSFLALLSSASNLKAIVVVVGIHVLGAATGGPAFIPYASLIFTSSEMLTANQYTILFGVAQFLTVAITPFIIERMNRRTLLILSFVGIAISNSCSYVLVYLHSKNYEVMFYPWLIFASIALYGGFYSLMSTGSYAVKGELLPLSVRAIGSSMAVIAQSFMSFSVAKVFFPITEKYGMEMNFLVYIAVSVFTIFFVYYGLPETRGKSLHEIAKSLKKGKKELPIEVDKKFDNAGDKFILA